MHIGLESGGWGNWHLGGGGKSGSIPVLVAKVVVVFCKMVKVFCYYLESFLLLLGITQYLASKGAESREQREIIRSIMDGKQGSREKLDSP